MSSSDGLSERGIQVIRTETFAEPWLMLSLLAAMRLRDHWSPAWAALPGAVYFLNMANAPLAVRMAGKERAQ